MNQSKIKQGFVFTKRPVQWVIVISISSFVFATICLREVSLRAALEDGSAVESNLGIRKMGLIVKVDLNSANAHELALLTGVGPVLASRIVADRKSRGAFESVDDLQRVRGIGPGKIVDIRRMAIVKEFAFESH